MHLVLNFPLDGIVITSILYLQDFLDIFPHLSDFFRSVRLLSHTHTGFLPAPAPTPACGFSHTLTLPEPSDSLFSSATEERCVLILIDGDTENGLENTGCIHF